jgi:hypothetical protein
MAGKLSSSSSGIQGGPGVASATITTNTRAKTSAGYIGLITDMVVFPTGTGVWMLGNQRVKINGIPTVGASSAGTFTQTNPVPLSTPMMVVNGDPRSDGM